MNERIKQLMERAMELVDPYAVEGEFGPSQLNAEKFAQLIVRECAELCKKQEYDYWRSSEDQDFTPIDCADAIKEHFGVKE
jgi:hypothetical protein